MSAESPRRCSKSCGAIVRPQPVSDKSVMESVVDFIQDVAYNHNQKGDDREKILWVHFLHADLNDISNNPDCSLQTGVVAPILIALGYTNGAQIWSIPSSGEAQELLSLRQGPIRHLRLLPNPKPALGRHDVHTSKRPLMALCDASSAGQPYFSVKFVSLRTGDEVHNIVFSYVVTDIKCNERVVVIVFSERIAVFDACQLKQLFWVTSCYPSPGHNPNPVALGTRWLAYADKKLVAVHQSCGGMTGDGRQSYAATVISAAKTITKGLTMFGETVAHSLTGSKPLSMPAMKEPIPQMQDGSRPGVITVIDIQTVTDGQMSVQEDSDGVGLIAHFPAHATEPIAAVSFDPSASMLLTTDRLGHNFHVFRLIVHPWSCALGAVHHLYTLHRGDTTAKVQDICFSQDSRWLAVSTLRGTTHVFPITPYGGPVNVRTHTSQRVVNRVSRFHHSAGLEDIASRPGDRDSPVLRSASPSSSPGRQQDQLRHLLHQNAINNSMGNPRLPPFPHPTTVTPLVQVKYSLNIPGLGGPASTTTGTGSGKGVVGGGGGSGSTDSMCVAACFASSRGWVAGSGSVNRDVTDKRSVDSLFILHWTGELLEYVLEPGAKGGTEKVTDESQLEVLDMVRAKWNLGRCSSSAEVRPPLTSNNPLILATDAVISQRPTELTGTLARQESRESLSSDHSSQRDDHEQWLSQVEIHTYVGPHRRLWMGPQFSFKTFQGTTTVLSSNSSVLLSQSAETPVTTMDVVSEDVDLQSLKIMPTRSSPVAMPGGKHAYRYPSGGDIRCASPQQDAFLIEAGSYEQSPGMVEACPGWPDSLPPIPGLEMADERLKEHLADAMLESPAKGVDRRPQHAELEHGSSENLSSSCGSGSSASRSHSFNANPSPPHSIEHVLVFPTGSDSN